MKYIILLLISLIAGLLWVYYEYLYPIPGEDEEFCLTLDDYNHKQMVAEESKLGCYVVICFCAFLAAIFWASE